MKTTPRATKEDLEAEAEEMLAAGLEDPIVELLEEVAQLKAELAALRRVEAEGFCASRYYTRSGARWTVEDSKGKCFGDADTLTEALTDYDMRAKEQR